MAKSCAYVLTLGRRHPKYSPSAYKTCITPTQALALFGTTARPKKLGCGVFACAFEHADPSKVVKITRDPSDVAGLLQGQGLPQVPKLYDSHRLVTRPWWVSPRQRDRSWQEWPEHPDAYALVVERLATLKGVEKATWNKRIRRMKYFKDDAERRGEMVAATSRGTAPAKPGARPSKAPTIGDMAKAVCPKQPQREAESCQLRVRELNKMTADLRARGVDWSDIHAGNIGMDAKGRWKALDLGASTTPLETDLPELEGARRRRR